MTLTDPTQSKSVATRLRLCSLGALCAAPYLIMFIWFSGTAKPRSLAALLLTTVLATLVLMACTRTWRRFFLAAFPLLIISIGYVAYSTGFGIVPGHTLSIVLMSASLEEVMGLFTVWHQKWLLLPLFGLLAVYVWLALGLPKTPLLAGKTFIAARVALALSVPLTLYAAQSPPQLVDGMALNPVVGSIMFFAGQMPRAYTEIHGGNVHKAPLHASRTGSDEEVHVLVIGESARRASWSLYGYARETTPYLDSISPELVLLRHAVTDANLTAYAVPIILTGYAPEEIQAAQPRGNILDLAKEAHYVTSWLVNQDLSISTKIGVTADRFVYPPDPKTTFFGRRVSDSDLLPAYFQELERGGHSRFIALHVMGSHWEYFERYPPKFQRWGSLGGINILSLFADNKATEAALRDCYDNSVLYTDWFLEQIIEGLRKLHVPATMTFLPDHGESLAILDDNYGGHGGPVFRPEQFSIPSFVWVNEAYRTAHADKVAALQANAAKEIRSHDFYYSIADLMGISLPDAKPERSFVSTSFVPDAGDKYLVGGVLRPIPTLSDPSFVAQR